MPADVKVDFGSASILTDSRTVFNIHGKKYRIVTWTNYDFGIIYVKFVGTHAQYDAIDAKTV
jgi:mRNA interferase HigB